MNIHRVQALEEELRAVCQDIFVFEARSIEEVWTHSLVEFCGLDGLQDSVYSKQPWDWLEVCGCLDFNSLVTRVKRLQVIFGLSVNFVGICLKVVVQDETFYDRVRLVNVGKLLNELIAFF